MGIKIYNTMTRQKELFVPLEEGKVKMYVCGPTVYNYIHIGNARPAIVFDTVRRYLEYRGFDVQFISNFTDVDDKLIKAANEMGSDVPTIAEKFINAYHEDTCALGVQKADAHPRVTETMPEIIEFIENLIKKGFAYEAAGDVYFKTRSFNGYGKLSHQSIDDLKSGARIEVGEKKEDPLDFALWKAAKEGEIYWESPWGNGRPGWHIECSAMAKKYLGDSIDIHGGGQDLTFPHHENEIAQSEALNEAPMAKYWMHNGYININNEKMSKSLGNFVLVHDLVKQQDPQVIRFFMLAVHYRNPINFSQELLEAAESGLNRIRTAYENLKHRLTVSADLSEDTDKWTALISETRAKFIADMDDDFNTANAISILFDFSREANVYLQEKNTSKAVITEFIALFDELTGVMGLTLHKEEELLDEQIDALIQERNQARKEKNFARADEIRDLLKEQNIILEDTAQGVRWKRDR
ncbi:cysteine--tRNA ligase [Fictibacillus barbaricus]|uniref:Cysteine--tRNA ligase n=1 Tax=Fictibacillus barbaricus TaxID=182136 RepID=A0ABS2ZBP6_9BACL|nr:cysteine--tRNA ligase [Fictibacillus barbaricus]MBN3544084.1 cysteine--tRNA ligase [Fictibacillus barbaricus]GGB70939.1 cysteine--tRNA ligase [Fictibacillus barbaricus]